MSEDKALKTLEDGIADVLRVPDSVGLARVPRSEPTLSDQIAQYERISHTIGEKIRKEQMAIRNDYNLKHVEVTTTYAARISEATAKLEKERDTELLALTETASRRLHDLEQLARRTG
jgi:hypothetical protein